MSPRLGLLTDTHDEIIVLDAALQCFHSSNCSIIIHLGDITTPETMRYLSANSNAIFWILGNEDSQGDWLSVSQEVGGVLAGRGYGVVEIVGHRFGLCHSTYERAGLVRIPAHCERHSGSS